MVTGEKMKTYARIVDGVAVDVVTGNIEEMFHPDLIPQFEEVPPKVKSGWIKNGKAWEQPAVEPEPQVTTKQFLKLPPSQFQFLFAFAEMGRIAELRKTDSAINAFWNIVDDPRTVVIDLASTTVQNAIRYTLDTIDASTVEARFAEIVAGKAI